MDLENLITAAAAERHPCAVRGVGVRLQSPVMRRVSEPGRIVTVVLLIGAAACLPEQAPAQGWKPVKNVELIVPGGAGGGQD